MAARRFSEVLALVGKIWINGADEFYGKLKPNPIQTTHDALENAFEENDWRTQEAALSVFEHKMTELMQLYRRMLELQNISPPKASLKDCFMKGFGDEMPPEEDEPVVEKKAGKFFN